MIDKEDRFENENFENNRLGHEAIICGFPGIGKSYATKAIEDRAMVSDSDSSLFNKEHFPSNYVKHLTTLTEIQKNTTKPLYIFASSHKEVREALLEAGLPFVVVVPHPDLKEEYLERYKERGSPEAFIKLLDANFENWIREVQADTRLKVVVLDKGQTLMDVI